MTTYGIILACLSKKKEEEKKEIILTPYVKWQTVIKGKHFTTILLYFAITLCMEVCYKYEYSYVYDNTADYLPHPRESEPMASFCFLVNKDDFINQYAYFSFWKSFQTWIWIKMHKY